MKRRYDKPKPFLIIFTAIAIVALLSLVPWSRLTGGFIKDYNLLADLFPSSEASATPTGGNEVVDPEYVSALEQMQQADSAEAKADTVALPVYQDHKEKPTQEARIDGQMVIEDYTHDGMGLQRVQRALASGNARIAVMGDSYIEGDILTQDLRSQLQSRYGGRGVGFVPGHSIAAGFRRTIRQTDNGLTIHGMQKAPSSPYFNISGEYFTAPGRAKVTYKSGGKERWDLSRLMYIAPNKGTITFRTDSSEYVVDVTPGEQVQHYSVAEPTGKFEIDINCPGLVFLGAWLEGNSGIGVDCMSVRGNSGINNRKLNVDLASQMRQHTDYDLIILEYGVNALTSKQQSYEHFGKMLQQSAERVRECYPNAQIMIMGIGDRGEKFQGEVHSMPTAPAMVDAQREAAKAAGCLFFDTREAMGGQDAIVEWKQRGLANSDYIHINSAGGKILATEIVNALTR